tara:strand:- start:268 stop:414 length:147 start_codon:yes stop_codon:yes gene_type:complete
VDFLVQIQVNYTEVVVQMRLVLQQLVVVRKLELQEVQEFVFEDLFLLQ